MRLWKTGLKTNKKLYEKGNKASDCADAYILMSLQQ